MKKTLSTLTLLIFLMLSGCAYYNTFYNAEMYFEEAVKEYEKLENKNAVPYSLKKKFNLAIEKANKTMIKYPESRWEDDALFLVAVANYYKGNNSYAKEKFEEFLNRFPASDLRPELEIWYGRNYWKMGDEEMAIFQWKKTAAKYDDNDLIADIYYSLADLFYNRGEIDSSLAYFAKITKLRGVENAAIAQFHVSEILFEKGQIDESISALKRVNRYSPSEELRGEMQIMFAKIYRESGRYEDAIDLINKKLNNENEKEIWGRLELQLGLIYLAQEKFDESRTRLTRVTEEYKKTEEAAEAYYFLAQLEMMAFKNYDVAMTNFKNVSKEYKESPYASESNQKASEIKRFLDVKAKLQPLTEQVNEITKSLLTMEVSETVVADTGSVDDMKKAVEEEQTQSNTIDTLRVFEEYYQYLYEAAELYYFNFGLLDSAVVYFDKIVSNQIYNPYIEKSLYALYFIYKREGNTEKSENYKNVFLDFPDSPYLAFINGEKPKESEIEAITNDKYLTAESYINTKPDSAIILFKELAGKYPETYYGEKAKYSIGWIYHNCLFNLDSTLNAYQNFMDIYPESNYTSEVKKQYNSINKMLNEMAQQAKNDSIQAAEAAAAQDSTASKPEKEQD